MIIALEKHLVVPSVLRAWSAVPTALEDWTAPFSQGVLGERLMSRRPGRLQDMDDQGPPGGSGMLSQRYLRWTMEMVGVERVTYSTDYPFIDTGNGLARSSLEDADITVQTRERIAHGNWDELTGHL